MIFSKRKVFILILSYFERVQGGINTLILMKRMHGH